MITTEQLKDVVLPVVALRKKELHKTMLTCPFDNLETVRIAIDEYTKLERFISNEMKKESSDFLNELNK
ncbi:hypothetical protein PYR66_09930 [Klebsiella aerogenes]|nr:hypothetical protein PYR66_09930 [Klebsiella aerogenes]